MAGQQFDAGFSRRFGDIARSRLPNSRIAVAVKGDAIEFVAPPSPTLFNLVSFFLTSSVFVFFAVVMIYFIHTALTRVLNFDSPDSLSYVIAAILLIIFSTIEYHVLQTAFYFFMLSFATLHIVAKPGEIALQRSFMDIGSSYLMDPSELKVRRSFEEGMALNYKKKWERVGGLTETEANWIDAALKSLYPTIGAPAVDVE